jgi:hypothetical protein
MGITNNIPPSRLIQPGVIDNTAARPSSPFEGQCIFQKDTDQLLVWNGTAWVIPNQTTQNPEGLELITSGITATNGTVSNGIVTIGSAVSSVTVSGAFSSTYDNYLITVAGGAGSTTTVMDLTLGSTTSNYYYTYTYANFDSTARVESQTTSNYWRYIGSISANGLNASIRLMSPFLSKETKITCDATGNGTAYLGILNGTLFNTTQYTSFTITAAAGTLTGGTIRVYGYRNS